MNPEQIIFVVTDIILVILVLTLLFFPYFNAIAHSLKIDCPPEENYANTSSYCLDEYNYCACLYETVKELPYHSCSIEFEVTANHGFVKTMSTCPPTKWRKQRNELVSYPG